MGQHASRRYCLERLESRRLLSAVPLGNLALTETTNNYTTGGNTSVVFNGALYYAVTRSQTVTELWRTDGTPGGASLVKSFNVVTFSDPTVSNLTVSGGKMYFTVGSITSNRSVNLWRSDGTTAGTAQVTSFSYGSAAFAPQLTDVAGTLFFTAPAVPQTGGGAVPTLLKTDGTAAGTKQVASTSSIGQVASLFADGGTLYYATDALYKVTATTNPVKVTAAAPTTDRSFADFDGALYFVAELSGQRKLYRYDGVAAPVEIANLYSDVNQRSPELTVVGNELYFASAQTSNGPVGLWQSDGTPAGTQLVDAINPTGSANPSNFTVVGNTLYFTATDGVHGAELWKSDGTADGTVMVADVVPGSTSSAPANLFADGDTLYFTARSSASGSELWRTDGTEAGTRQVADLYRGPGASRPHELLTFNGDLYFQATDSVTGYGLFKTRPADDAVNLVADYNAGLMNGTISSAIAADGRLFFAAGDGSPTGRELYVSDGTAAGTVLFKDIFTTAFAGSSPDSLTSVNGTIFFSAIGSANQGNELWKTDGTSAGTVIVKDTGPSGLGAAPRLLTPVGTTLFYVGNDEVSPTQADFWKSDGTAQGTVTVHSSPDYALPNGNRIVKGSAVYFLNGSTVFQKFDPAVGIISIKDFTTFNVSSPVNSLGLVGNVFYMAVDNGTTGSELWRSDGTQQGTVLVKDINTNTNINLGNISSFPNGFTDVNGVVCFAATDLAGGTELWRTDGTAAGTVLVKDIRAGAVSSAPQRLIKLGTGKILFTADDGVHGRELWQTNGNANATVLLADLNPGVADSNPADFTVIGNLMYFTADDGTAGGGRRLFVTDGLPGGTHGLTAPGSNPMNLVNVNGTLYYTANDGQNGPQLYKLDTSIAGPAVGLIQFNPAGARPVLTVDFNIPIADTLRASDLGLRNRTTGQLIDPAAFHIDVNAADNQATVTVNAPLADGDYRLTLFAGSLHDAAGSTLAADVTSDFFVLAGDANHDRTVDFNDLVILAQNYNKSGKTFAQGDFNYDGTVDFNDLVLLAQRYNTTLAFPAPAAPSAAAPSIATVSAELLSDTSRKNIFSLTRVAPPRPPAPPAKAKPSRPTSRRP